MIVAELSCASEKGVSFGPPLRRGDHGFVPAEEMDKQTFDQSKEHISSLLVDFCDNLPPKGGHSRFSEEREAVVLTVRRKTLGPLSPSKEV